MQAGPEPATPTRKHAVASQNPGPQIHLNAVGFAGIQPCERGHGFWAPQHLGAFHAVGFSVLSEPQATLVVEALKGAGERAVAGLPEVQFWCALSSGFLG